MGLLALCSIRPVKPLTMSEAYVTTMSLLVSTLRLQITFECLALSLTDPKANRARFCPYSHRLHTGHIPSYTTPSPPSNDYSQLGGRIAANNFTISGTWTPTPKLI